MLQPTGWISRPTKWLDGMIIKNKMQSFVEFPFSWLLFLKQIVDSYNTVFEVKAHKLDIVRGLCIAQWIYLPNLI